MCVTVRVSVDIDEEMSYNTAERCCLSQDVVGKMFRFEKQKQMTSCDFRDTFMESGFSPVDK